jgi:hypothetical protein
MIKVEILSQTSVDVELEGVQEVGVDIMGQIIPVGEYKHYEGEYSVTPKFENQTLQTKNKVMDFDVDVKTIPLEKVANSSGGNTVIIGG